MDPVVMNAAQTAAESVSSSMDPFVVMVVGMAVVFLGLIILIGVVKLVGAGCRAIFGEKKAAPSTKQTLPPAPASKGSAAAPSALTDAQRGELIAAISCAIAENMGKPVSGIRIRSIRKVG